MITFDDFKNIDGYFVNDGVSKDINIRVFADRSGNVGAFSKHTAFINQYSWSKSEDFEAKVLPYIDLYIATTPDNNIPKNLPQFIVPDLKLFALQMAKMVRSKIDIPVIGITGSAGKTTTKNMTVDLLGRRGFEVLTNRGNHNNSHSTPFYIMNTIRKPQYCVLEISETSFRDDTASVAKINVGIITNIGAAHIGAYGSLEKLIEIKSRMIDALSEDGTIIINKDAPDNIYDFLVQKAVFMNKKIATFSLKDHSANAYLINKNWDNNGCEITASINDTIIKFKLPIGSDGFIQNALASLLAVNTINAPIDSNSLKRLENFSNLNKILNEKIFNKNDYSIKVIDDTHNASIPAMKNAIHYFAELSKFHKGNKILVLSQVADLGKDAQSLHDDLIPDLVNSNADYILLYAPLMKSIATELRKNKLISVWFDNLNDLIYEINSLITDDSLILMKGSRSGSDFIEINDKLIALIEKEHWKIAKK